MANYSGQNPSAIARYGGYVEWDDGIVLPLGVAAIAQNVRYQAESVGTRFGLQRTMKGPNARAITGLALLKHIATDPAKYQFVFDQGGNLLIESPAGSGTLVPVNPTGFSLPANCHATATTAFNKMWMGFTDLLQTVAPVGFISPARPAVYNADRGVLDQISDPPQGDTWQAHTRYRVGQIVTASAPGGKWFRANAITSGQSGAVEPLWPAGEGATVADFGVTWKEATPNFGIAQPEAPAPVLAPEPGAGALAAGRDVYVRLSIVNGSGETDVVAAGVSSIINTGLNDRIRVTMPAGVPAWLQALPAPYLATGVNVYAADVATGDAAPSTTAYAQIGATQAFGATLNIDQLLYGAAAPQVNTAVISPAGNICAGLRYMIVLYENRNGYILGYSDALPVGSTIGSSGRQLYVGRIPIGPANTAKRICCFTVAGDIIAGRYRYIDSNVVASAGPGMAGILNTSTVIADNVSTSATFNFLDVLLAQAVEVTDFAEKIQVPPCTEVMFSKTLNAMVYTSPTGFESGFLVSDAGDPETVRVPNSVVQVAEQDGDRTVCWREVGSMQLALKENSGHVVSPNAGDPATWAVNPKWTGHGPVGARAADAKGQLLVYAARIGPYAMRAGDSEPTWMGLEVKKTWRRINQRAMKTICVCIDDEAREVSFLLPLDGAMTPNYRLRVNYAHGEGAGALFEPPILFSVRLAKYFANPGGRKWSLEPLQANLMLTAERDLAASVDSRIDHRQVLYGSGANDGVVRMEVPDLYHDEDANGAPVGYLSQYRSVPLPNDKLMVLRFGGGTTSAKGSGYLNISAISDKNEVLEITREGRQFLLDSYDERNAVIAPPQEKTFDGPIARAPHRERWAIQWDNGGVADAWFELHKAIFYSSVHSQGRRG